MICLIANSYGEAKTWARGQFLAADEWFHLTDIDDLNKRTNFHVLVVGNITHNNNIPGYYFERLYALAQQRGRINRK